ncbi:MAG TPA: FAD binding domain-containing protein [Candidatus Limnocylindrales bacterium]|nr:FAD binding domain-containing protein [Candidatus Limnocylindrales bacterium]
MTVSSYFLPRSVPEALGLLERHGPDLLVMAGGTVAMPLINDGLSIPGLVMGLRYAGFDRLERIDGALRIGATTTLTRLLGESGIPMLQDAARSTANPTIRNMATVGGNLFTPPPGGDVAVALLALDASVTLASSRGERVLPLADFYTGFLTNELAADELLVALDVPAPAANASTAYIKFGRKDANTPAVATVAVSLAWNGDRVADARIALGAAGPHPNRARAAERLVVGTALAPAIVSAAAVAAAEESEPFTDAIASDWYRRRMIGLHVARALEQLTPDHKSEDH